MAKITSVKEFRDILLNETPKWQRVEEQIREIFFNSGIQEIRIPVLRKPELFKRGIGEATDIVEKGSVPLTCSCQVVEKLVLLFTDAHDMSAAIFTKEYFSTNVL